MKSQTDQAGAVTAMEQLIACERVTWGLIQRKDFAGFARYLAEDFYDVFPDGQERNKAELLEFIRTADLQEYQLSNFRVTLLTADAAVVTYWVDAQAIIEGEHVSMRNAVTAGWARRDGAWSNVFAVARAR